MKGEYRVRPGVKPGILVFFFILALLGSLNAEGIELLSQKVADNIIDFFGDKYFQKVSIVKFENYSGLSDLSAQKFYQLLVSKLESHKKVNFVDLMIDFSGKRGVFNENARGQDRLHYLVYIKLTRNRNKIGAGTAIFSQSLDKIVHIKYNEAAFHQGEKDILNTVNYGFKNFGFSKILEMTADPHLLDLQTIKDLKGKYRYYFYYPEKIVIYELKQNNLDKIFSFELNWRRPYYPVQEPEGKLMVFYAGQVLYLIVGGNFAPYSMVFSLQNHQWRELNSINIVPFKLVEINQNKYLAGARYENGKNYFGSKILLAPFDEGMGSGAGAYEKRVNFFYSIDFSTDDNRLNSVHMIDKDYNYRFYTADLEEAVVDRERRGSCLASLDGRWLAVSDYSRVNDKLYFYKIENGARRLVYEQEIKGEVVFLSPGTWKTREGFWVYVKIQEKHGKESKLQFWSENPAEEGKRENEKPSV